MSDSALQAASQWLSQQRNEMVRDLIELANLNSGSSNLAGLRRTAEWLVQWMGLEQTSFESLVLPPRKLINDRAENQQAETGNLLLWHCRREAERKLLLGIHYDTVYGNDHALQTCTLLSCDRLAGPGVADAKGGIVVLRYALLATKKFELANNLGWTVFLNPDEEIGSPSSSAALRELATGYESALLFEPALPDGALVSQRKGSGQFTIVARGRAAHAGRDFHRGRNAITHLAKLLTQLASIHNFPLGTTVNVGHIVGGGPVNVVPDVALARVNIRVPDPASASQVEIALRNLVNEFSVQDGLMCELHGGFHAPPKVISPSMRRLMDSAETAAHKLGQQIRWTSAGGVSDGNRLAAAGLPTIDTLGPIGDGLHSANEWVSINSLVEKAIFAVELINVISCQSDGVA